MQRKTGGARRSTEPYRPSLERAVADLLVASTGGARGAGVVAKLHFMLLMILIESDSIESTACMQNFSPAARARGVQRFEMSSAHDAQSTY